MPQPAIRIQQLSKRYEIGVRERGATENLREAIAGWLTNPVSRLRRLSARSEAEAFWALKNVTLDINEGDVVGLVGRNGAGKSTLLKILSQITEPTGGRVEIAGRVASLLEVGTGFHGELTGRENVFLNGAILGMSRREIRAKFDEIVAFAEVEKFLDTPVKRYSSGMYMRLAFAIAAHLDPEILIVDEVLAVGDARFQKKCLGRISDVARNGRTVLFVSHDLTAVTRLCTKGVLLADGQVVTCGPMHQVIQVYLNGDEHGPAQRVWSPPTAPGNQIARLRGLRAHNRDGATMQRFDIRQPIGVELEYEVLASGHILTPNVHLYNSDGICLFIAFDWDGSQKPLPAGRYRSTAWIPGNLLAEGTVSVGVALSTMETNIAHFYELDLIAIDIADTLQGGSARGEYGGNFPGTVRPILEWRTETVPTTGRVAA